LPGRDLHPLEQQTFHGARERPHQEPALAAHTKSATAIGSNPSADSKGGRWRVRPRSQYKKYRVLPASVCDVMGAGAV